MKQIEVEGATREEALAEACTQLKIVPQQAAVEVLEESKAALFGLFGRNHVRLKVTVKTSSGPEKEEGVKTIVGDILALMKFESKINKVFEEDNNLIVEIESQDSAVLIGKKGQNINALQIIVNQIVNRSSGGMKKTVVLDVGNYRQKRRNKLKELARELAEKVKSTGQSQETNLLGPGERKVIHTALENDPLVRSSSVGQGSFKRVVVSLKK